MKSAFFLLMAACLVAISCQNNGNYQSEHFGNELNDSASVTGFTGDSVKLVKTADVHLKVKAVEESAKTISATAKKYGGAVHFHNFRSPQTGQKELNVSDDSLLVITTISPQADLTVRIHSTGLEAFLFDVLELVYYTENVLLKVDDKSLLYLENELKRKSRTDAITQRRKHDSAISWQALQVKDEAIAQFIANKTIDAEADFSTIHLSLTQNAVVQKELIANYRIASYELPITTQIGQAFAKGGDVFLSLLIALLHFWPFLLLSILIYTGYRLWRQRKVVV